MKLTREQIWEMPAGREADLLVSTHLTKACGWHRKDGSPCLPPEGYEADLPPCSTDVAWAVLLADALYRRGWLLSLRRHDVDGEEWLADFHRRDSGDSTGDVPAPTAAHAVTKAALLTTLED